MHWLLLLLLLVSCGGRAVVGADGPAPARYLVRIGAEFGPILDPTTEAHLQDDKSAELSLRLSVVPTRRFVDGSIGQRVQIDQGALNVDGNSFDELELVGRSIELRTFPDGEILSLGWIDRWAGPRRFMEVFEVVFPAISPAPPSLKKGETASRRIIWPFLGQHRLRWDSAVDARWTNHGSIDRGTETVWHLAYEGPWRIHGGRRSGPEAIKVTSTGDAEGQVWFDKASGELVAHEFSWSREVHLAGAGGRLKQMQAFNGRVERLP